MSKLNRSLQIEKVLLEQLPGVILSATDGNTQLKQWMFTQNGDELISEFVALVDTLADITSENTVSDLAKKSPEATDG